MDVPTPPTNVFVDTVFQDNCVAHWGPPKDDGGTDIKKYIIEQLDNTTGNGNWTECAQTQSGKERQIKVEHLTPMHRYRFRARAANKIGPSDPCEMTGPDILAKDPWGMTFKLILLLLNLSVTSTCALSNVISLIFNSSQTNPTHAASPNASTGGRTLLI